MKPVRDSCATPHGGDCLACFEAIVPAGQPRTLRRGNLVLHRVPVHQQRSTALKFSQLTPFLCVTADEEDDDEEDDDDDEGSESE